MKSSSSDPPRAAINLVPCSPRAAAAIAPRSALGGISWSAATVSRRTSPVSRRAPVASSWTDTPRALNASAVAFPPAAAAAIRGDRVLTISESSVNSIPAPAAASRRPARTSAATPVRVDISLTSLRRSATS